jgi:phenylacetate-CoA ligase
VPLPHLAFHAFASLVGFVPIQWRLGPEFRRTRHMLADAVDWRPDDIRAWQLTRLQEIIRFSQEHVPFYRHTLKRLGMHWEDIRSLEDIRNLPTLSKQQIVADPESFVADTVDPKRLVPALTGGSTGAPMRFFIQKNHSSVQQAFLDSILRRFDCRSGDRFVVLRTQRKSRNPLTPYWTVNPHRNQLVISSYLLSTASVSDMAAAIDAFKPKYILGIPSTMALFCHYARTKIVRIRTAPRVIILGSENSYVEQRRMISETFGAPTIMHYGQGEAVAAADEGSPYSGYDVNPFYGFAEVLSSDGKALVHPGGCGEIIGTGFHNFAMPLIRYRTGDDAVIGDGCSRWGLQGDRWEGIAGRLVELVCTKDRRWLMLAALIFGTHDSTLTNVHQIQVEQFEPGLLILRLFRGQGYSLVDEANILRMINELSHNGFEVSFEYVEGFERLSSGKHRLLIQHLRVPGNFEGIEETTTGNPHRADDWESAERHKN